MSVLSKIDYILETFKELGKLPQEKLKKGQALYVNDNDNFKKVNGRIFFNSINKIRENDIIKLNKGLPSKGLITLTVYKLNDYKKMDCYIGKNNSSGYCLNNGELVSVFSSQKSSANAIMTDAVKNGAIHLDCYAKRNPVNGKISGPLYKLYTQHGFKIDKTMNVGEEGKPYTIINGISDYVDDNGEVQPNDPKVVIFMKR